MYSTKNCVHCGEKATGSGGHVLAGRKNWLGGQIPVKVLAGCCDSCFNLREAGLIESDENGCYGFYSPNLHGPCVPFNFKQQEN